MNNTLRKALALGLSVMLLATGSMGALADETTPAEADAVVVQPTPQPINQEDAPVLVDDATDDVVADAATGETEAAPAQTDVEADDAQADVDTSMLTTASRYFVRSGYVRRRKVTYYDNVYCYNHKEYVYTPFASEIPSKYFVTDETGCLAIAPIVLDITDAMRERLYGADVGTTALLYGQYCERIQASDRREGFSGIHEGIDFIYQEGAPLHAILDGVVTRAGDRNGTVGIYNETYDITVLYLHTEKISVKRGDTIEAGAQFGFEGNKKSGSPYCHVEVRFGRHTSSSPYRDVFLESDLPYDVMQKALNVSSSGREPITSAAILKAEELLRQAEAEAQRIADEEAARLKAEEEAQRIADEEAAAAEAAAAAAEAARIAEEEAASSEKLLEEAPDDETKDGYGFGEAPEGKDADDGTSK